MKNLITVFYISAVILILSGCNNQKDTNKIRQQVDTIGFAPHSWQLDRVLKRIERSQARQLFEARRNLKGNSPLRVAVSPHDDYSYVGYLYPALFEKIRSKVVILFGVGHKAKSLNLEDQIVFGSFTSWKSPEGFVKVSGLQHEIIRKMPGDQYVINDSLQAVEHSLEALIPFIELYNPDAAIIPIIVPSMSFERMEEISLSLASAISETMEEAKLKWGEGWSIVISSDAVHYGNEDWGGKNYDSYGVDSAGYHKAVEYENNIVNNILCGTLSPEKIKAFYSCTVQDSDYHEYKWTWCGRYSVPLGLLTAFKLAQAEDSPLTGFSAGYSTSIANPPIPVSDIRMGTTAPAKLTHWVGYTAVGYR